MRNIYLVTGATSDAALGLMRHLLRHGDAGDVIVAQAASEMEKLAPLTKEFTGRIRTFHADLQSQTAVDAFVKNVSNTIGCPTHLVHLAAATAPDAVEGALFNVNAHGAVQSALLSAVTLCEAFLPAMRQNQRGQLLFWLPPKEEGALSAVVQQALRQLAAEIAQDNGAYGITANCVVPSNIESVDTASQSTAPAEEKAAGDGSEAAADTMAFLLSEAARCTTGAVLPIVCRSVV